jgi:nitrogen regulatory protein PII
MLKKVECYVEKSSLTALRDALVEDGVEGMTVSEAEGFGRRSETDRNGRPILAPRLKIEIVVDEETVEPVIRRISRLATTGKIGNGKIFVLPVEDALRISTRESGKSAIY